MLVRELSGASRLEVWHPALLRWVASLPEQVLLPDSVLVLRLRLSSGPLVSDTPSGLVCELFGSTSRLLSAMHGPPSPSAKRG